MQRAHHVSLAAVNGMVGRTRCHATDGFAILANLLVEVLNSWEPWSRIWSNSSCIEPCALSSFGTIDNTDARGRDDWQVQTMLRVL